MSGETPYTDAAPEALAALLAWRTEDMLTGTATDDATLRLRDVADRLSEAAGGDPVSVRHDEQIVAALSAAVFRLPLSTSRGQDDARGLLYGAAVALAAIDSPIVGGAK